MRQKTRLCTGLTHSLTARSHRHHLWTLMEVTIKFLNGDTFPLRVSPDITVWLLKQKIKEKKHVEPSSQRLYVQNGQRIDLSDDSKKLHMYGLKDGDVVAVLIQQPPQPTTIQIFLKNEKNQMHTYDISPNETVTQFKEKVARQEGVPVSQQRLVFEGKQLEDGRKLADYNIRAASTIFLLLRLRGG
ncbi:polyubiquitin-like [Amia ocellicauda]|uniref:polyubiquitin n=1 Tax=Amia ocellicauda TaxID=2972642 RepID=UPI003464B5A5